MLVEPDRKRHFPLAKRSPLIRQTLMDVMFMEMGKRAYSGTRQTPWVDSLRTYGVFTICTATSGSGAKIGSEIIQKLPLLIRKGRTGGNFVCSVAVRIT